MPSSLVLCGRLGGTGAASAEARTSLASRGHASSSACSHRYSSRAHPANTRQQTNDYDLPMEEYRRAGLEITKGNPDVYKSLWSRRDDVTLANPFGPPVRGWEEVSARLDLAASNYRDGQGYAGPDSPTLTPGADRSRRHHPRRRQSHRAVPPVSERTPRADAAVTAASDEPRQRRGRHDLTPHGCRFRAEAAAALTARWLALRPTLEHRRCGGASTCERMQPSTVTEDGNSRARRCARGSPRRRFPSRPGQPRGLLPPVEAAWRRGSPPRAPRRARSGTLGRRCRA